MRWTQIIIFHVVFTFDTAQIYCNWNTTSTTVGYREILYLNKVPHTGFTF